MEILGYSLRLVLVDFFTSVLHEDEGGMLTNETQV